MACGRKTAGRGKTQERDVSDKTPGEQHRSSPQVSERWRRGRLSEGYANRIQSDNRSRLVFSLKGWELSARGTAPGVCQNTASLKGWDRAQVLSPPVGSRG